MGKANFPDYLNILELVNVDDVYIRQAFDYYHQCYLNSLTTQDFVKHSDRLPEEISNNSMIGFCDRTLGSHISGRCTLEGGAIRGSLQRFGLIKATGHELFRGCVVFPTVDKNGEYVSAVGYRIAKRIRHWESPIIHWRKPQPEAFIGEGMKAIKRLIHG